MDGIQRCLWLPPNYADEGVRVFASIHIQNVRGVDASVGLSVRAN